MLIGSCRCLTRVFEKTRRPAYSDSKEEAWCSRSEVGMGKGERRSESTRLFYTSIMRAVCQYRLTVW